MVFNFDTLLETLPEGTSLTEYIIKMLIMFAIGGILIYLAIKKEYEPALLLPIGFGAILANIPLTSIVENPVTGELGILVHCMRRQSPTSFFRSLFLLPLVQ